MAYGVGADGVAALECPFLTEDVRVFYGFVGTAAGGTDFAAVGLGGWGGVVAELLAF